MFKSRFWGFLSSSRKTSLWVFLIKRKKNITNDFGVISWLARTWLCLPTYIPLDCNKYPFSGDVFSLLFSGRLKRSCNNSCGNYLIFSGHCMLRQLEFECNGFARQARLLLFFAMVGYVSFGGWYGQPSIPF